MRTYDIMCFGGTTAGGNTAFPRSSPAPHSAHLSRLLSVRMHQRGQTRSHAHDFHRGDLGTN